jgi:hypothetical protein
MLPREPYKIKNISFIANIDDVGDELAIIRMELEIPESDEILAVINKVCDTCLERRMFSPHVLQEFIEKLYIFVENSRKLYRLRFEHLSRYG